MRAIDLYSGVGGWSLGLKLAGVQVVASYEIWEAAVATYNANLGTKHKPFDVRRLVLSDLPRDIDLVVGSPPCTQFSYSNRGGDGDLSEGMKDLVRYFEVVEHLQPRYWAMENVPRVAALLRGIRRKRAHPLYRFRALFSEIHVLDLSELGTPQTRRRCIVGNYPLDLMEAYARKLPRPTLGSVVSALSEQAVISDPLWGVALPTSEVSERETEIGLTNEELRMNREAKQFHPVYNDMSFPDRLDRPARTVTATCTRVSRESIVIPDARSLGGMRRLSIRERATLQGFPITYEFLGRSNSEKVKMVGNAIPPTFTYLLGLSVKGLTADAFGGFCDAKAKIPKPNKRASPTTLERAGSSYSANRSFRAALPTLRFKSGMRFEFANSNQLGLPDWRVSFFFGSSRDIRELPLDQSTLNGIGEHTAIQKVLSTSRREVATVEKILRSTSPSRLQAAWSRRDSGILPFEVSDHLGSLSDTIFAKLASRRGAQSMAEAAVFELVTRWHDDDEWIGREKLRLNSVRVLSGLVVGSWFNTLGWHAT